MRKPITFANVALIALAVWMAIGIRTTWRQNHARYARLPVRGATARPGAAAGSPGAGFTMASYTELVGRNLFSADRNNDQPVIRIEKKPRPPLPVVVGTMNLPASGKVALMGAPQDASQGRFRRMKVGEEIDGFKLVEIADRNVVVEFDGEKISIEVYESAPVADGRAPAPPPPVPNSEQEKTAGVTTPAPQPPTQAQNQPAVHWKPGDPITKQNEFGVQDLSLEANGTAFVRYEGNTKVVTRLTPFGPWISREPIKPGEKPQ